MFEVRIPMMMKEYEQDPLKQNLLTIDREHQICQVVKSLSEEEFQSLQSNFVSLFQEVKELLEIVHSMIQQGMELDPILLAVENKYQRSMETSQYYKDIFLKTLSFLRRHATELRSLEDSSLDSNRIQSLSLAFSDEVINPFQRYQDTVIQILGDRNQLESLFFNDLRTDVSVAECRLELYQMMDSIIRTQLEKLSVTGVVENELSVEQRKMLYDQFLVEFQLEEWAHSMMDSFNEWNGDGEYSLINIEKKQLEVLASYRQRIADIRKKISEIEAQKRRFRKKQYKPLFQEILEIIEGDFEGGFFQDFSILWRMDLKDATTNELWYVLQSSSFLRSVLENYLERMESALNSRELFIRGGWICDKDQHVLHVLDFKGYALFDKYCQWLDEHRYTYIMPSMGFNQFKEGLRQKDFLFHHLEMADMRMKLFRYIMTVYQLSSLEEELLYRNLQSGSLDSVVAELIEKIKAERVREKNFFSEESFENNVQLLLLQKDLRIQTVSEQEVMDAIVKKIKRYE